MSTHTKVIVGLSGGVDSSVAALLLKQAGYQVEGLFMKNWEEDDRSDYCSAKEDLKDVRSVCQQLKIPLHTQNFSQEYWDKVFYYFLEEHKKGRTPNPDILCNQEIKFKVFLDHAKALGADYIATGHYVRKKITSSPHGPIYSLHKGCDPQKDQSYFLYTLNQHPLKNALFPIGDCLKTDIRKIAKDHHLRPYAKKDSTGICFIGERKFKHFLQEFLPHQPGPMLTPKGQYIKDHDGLMYYTLGQRKGLGIGGQRFSSPHPWYVVAKDVAQNALIVTQDSQHPFHFSKRVCVTQLNWVCPIEHLDQGIECQAKARYRQADVPCHIQLTHDKHITVTYHTPQRAITPGQSMVFYQGDDCLGGGIIEYTDSPGGLMNTTPSTHDSNLSTKVKEPA